MQQLRQKAGLIISDLLQIAISAKHCFHFYCTRYCPVCGEPSRRFTEKLKLRTEKWTEELLVQGWLVTEERLLVKVLHHLAVEEPRLHVALRRVDDELLVLREQP